MTKSSGDELIVFCQLLRTAIESRLPLPQGLRDFADHLDEGEAKRWADSLSERLENGHSLAAAVSSLDGIDPLLGILVSVPNGRGLGIVLASYARFLMMTAMVRDKLKSALFYPLLVLGMTAINLVLCNLHLFPALEEAYSMKQGELPWIVNALYVANPDTWPLSIFCLFLLFALPLWFGGVLVMENLPQGANNPLARGFLLYAFHRAEKRSRLYETIALSLEGGGTLPESLRLAKIHEPYRAGCEVLERAAKAIEEGREHGEVFAQFDLFAPVAMMVQPECQVQQWISAFRSASAAELRKALTLPQNIELICGTVGVLMAGILVGVCGYAFFSPYFGFATVPWK